MTSSLGLLITYFIIYASSYVAVVCACMYDYGLYYEWQLHYLSFVAHNIMGSGKALTKLVLCVSVCLCWLKGLCWVKVQTFAERES